jgi:hypothetical protein
MGAEKPIHSVDQLVPSGFACSRLSTMHLECRAMKSKTRHRVFVSLL